MNVEYYTLGSLKEPEGLTLMTRIVDDDGNPLMSIGSPENWYKPKKITKEEAEKYFGDKSRYKRGFVGIVDDDGAIEHKRIIDEYKNMEREKEALKLEAITIGSQKDSTNEEKELAMLALNNRCNMKELEEKMNAVMKNE